MILRNTPIAIQSAIRIQFVYLALGFVSHRSLFNDENTDCWTNEALCPNSLYTHNHASPKFLKMRILKPAGQLEHLLSSHLSAGESANLSFNPNALRYSCGYYIYALLHILI